MTIRERLHRYLVKRTLRHWQREVIETEQTIGRLQAYLERAVRQRDAARSDVIWLDIPGHLHPQYASGRVDRATWLPQPKPQWCFGMSDEQINAMRNDPMRGFVYNPAASRVAGPGPGDER